jgi:hypothetical protein
MTRRRREQAEAATGPGEPGGLPPLQGLLGRARVLIEECRRHGLRDQAERPEQRARDVREPLLLMVVGEGNFSKSALVSLTMRAWSRHKGARAQASALVDECVSGFLEQVARPHLSRRCGATTTPSERHSAASASWRCRLDP